jgi:hypothetical protein
LFARFEEKNIRMPITFASSNFKQSLYDVLGSSFYDLCGYTVCFNCTYKRMKSGVTYKRTKKRQKTAKNISTPNSNVS